MNEHELENMIGVYALINLKTGKVYVGSTVQSFRNRKRDHFNQLRAGRHFNKHLQSAWDRYGRSSFLFVTLEICQVKQCLRCEQKWIDRLMASDREYGFNGRPKAESNLGKRFGPHTLETKAKMSASGGNRRGVKLSLATRQKISRSTKGVIKRSAEFKENLRKLRIGYRFSDKSKRKMSAAAKRRFAISTHNRKGVHLTEEHKAKLSVARKGKKLSAEHRAKLSIVHKDRPWSASRRAASVRT